MHAFKKYQKYFANSLQYYAQQNDDYSFEFPDPLNIYNRYIYGPIHTFVGVKLCRKLANLVITSTNPHPPPKKVASQHSRGISGQLACLGIKVREEKDFEVAGCQ